jgi:glycosidase
MFFTTNHDENSWNGTVFERMGKNHLNFFVLATTFPDGMPLIYSGQEGGLNKRLAFFEKDTINWSDSTYHYFYQSMMRLKERHPALVNGEEQGSFERVDVENPNIYAFLRKPKQGTENLMVLLNFGEEDVELPNGILPAKFTVPMGGKGIRVSPKTMNHVAKAHDFLVLTYEEE